MVDNKKMLFTELFSAAKTKFEIITIFLAILELIKIREIIIVQAEPFGEIEIMKNPETVKPPNEGKDGEGPK